MGKLAKIETGKTSSDAFTGCAPVDWVLSVAKDFGEWLGKGIYNIASDVGKKVTNFFGGALGWVGNVSNFVGNLPGIKQAQQAAGVMVAVGRSVVSAAMPCIRTTLAGLGVAGALGVAAGGIYLLANTGFFGGIITLLTLGTLARFCIRGVGKAYRFNWNITDEQIKQRYSQSLNSLAAQAGSVVGAGLAAVACGVGGSAIVMRFNPTAAALCKEVLEESWDEVLGNAKSLLRSAASATEQWITLEIYRNVRGAIKKAAANPTIKKFLPDGIEKAIAYWGSPGSKPWSFATAIEEAIENVKPKAVSLFLEEAREEFAEVCSQATYALSYGL